MALLYRQTASDLATIREDPSSRNLAHYLNQLLGRAHNLIYMGRRSRPAGIINFYRETFPQIFHETLPYTLLAAAIFFATAAAGLMVAVTDPGFQRYLLGPAMMDTIEKQQMWTHSVVTVKPLASSAIMTNNLAVSFTTFALGITAGIGTVGCWRSTACCSAWLTARAGTRGCWPADEFCRAAWRARIAGDFHRRAARDLLLAKGLLFPGTLPRRASLAFEGRPRRASRAGDHSHAHRRRHHRRFRLALRNCPVDGNTLSPPDCSACCCST